MKSEKDFEIIATIREYENSVAMPDNARLTYFDAHGGIHLKGGDGSAVKQEAYAKNVLTTCVSAMRLTLLPAAA